MSQKNLLTLLLALATVSALAISIYFRGLDHSTDQGIDRDNQRDVSQRAKLQATSASDLESKTSADSGENEAQRQVLALQQQRWDRRQRQQQSRDDRRGVPDWENDSEFEKDVFTFCRLKYSEGNGGRGGRGRRRGWGDGGRWRTDHPDSDLNFSFRLQQLTSLKVNPDPIYLEATDERLFDYPFLYMIEPQSLYLNDDEVSALRRYFANGGFMMVDDFWGEYEYFGFYRQIKKVFPNQEPVKLTVDHPIFHSVYDLKEMPQVPSLHSWQNWGVSYEREDASEVDYRAIYDENGRMVVIICHNTDLGDGWEREGEDKEYFRLFSERLAYPMGINIVVYAMTH